MEVVTTEFLSVERELNLLKMKSGIPEKLRLLKQFIVLGWS